MSKESLINVKAVNQAKTDATDVAEETYVFKLFVTGILPNSVRAIINCKALCEKYLENRYELEIIDIYQQPEYALAEDIIAVPVLIKKFPLPEGRVIGDLSDIKKVLKDLDLIY
ncbi:circadian clock KaiB family protein [Flavobacterium sp. GT3R68]|uniref:circadian clock KaiB family protein n=1 Tax=Flavobacterium sp. GT3R68 TaxID=2594437 RepID=UPI000F88094A|nr:circadian clock KaiB family protein [Flavobacterium sp. GT3R68]RTY89831.1 circadian clock protein KaiB [Flavobacterium sp. GSN2]TRW89810.1 circadian clock protein KaiB [Flavobacterium sp. GT3R68]